MKRIPLFLVLILFFGLVNAQDVIITNDAQKISVKVSDIGEEVIKYKRYDNLEGPTYTMRKSEISSIIFENGTVEVFKDQPAKNPHYTRNDGYMNGEVRFVTRKIGDVSGYGFGSGTLTTSGFFFAEGASSMSDAELARAIRENPQNILTDGEYKSYIQQYAPDAYKAYQKGNSLGITGTVFLAVGLSTLVMSPLWLLYDDHGDKNDMTGFIGAMSMLGAGTVLALGSIPFYSVAFHKMRVTSCDIYNENYARKSGRTEASFNIGANRYGVGISLRF